MYISSKCLCHLLMLSVILKIVFNTLPFFFSFYPVFSLLGEQYSFREVFFSTFSSSSSITCINMSSLNLSIFSSRHASLYVLLLGELSCAKDQSYFSWGNSLMLKIRRFHYHGGQLYLFC